jgi:predicted nucleic acid-binding protein
MEMRMNLIADTSVIIAVITNEDHKSQLIEISRGSDLIAPSSIHWEIGNAFSAMFKHNRISLDQATAALAEYNRIPIRFHDVSLSTALDLAYRFNIYANDAYVIVCALKHNSPIVSLDNGLLDAARKAGAETVEVDI